MNRKMSKEKSLKKSQIFRKEKFKHCTHKIIELEDFFELYPYIIVF